MKKRTKRKINSVCARIRKMEDIAEKGSQDDEAVRDILSDLGEMRTILESFLPEKAKGEPWKQQK